MNEHLLECVVGTVLFVVVAACSACAFVGSLWTIVLNIRAVKTVNRMGDMRNGRNKCPDLGNRLVSRVTPATVMLLLLLHAYVHPDKQIIKEEYHVVAATTI